MLKCLGCGRHASASDEDSDTPSAATPAAAPAEAPAEAPAPAEALAESGDGQGGTAAKDEAPPREAEEGAEAKHRTLNALGLRVDATVESELQELGMDPSVLLEPLTPRSLMTSTPYPGKRSSVVLRSLDDAMGLDSADSDEASSPDLPPDMLPALTPRERDGTVEPPATPVGRDELALRRHRFFADLINAAQAAAEHRVRFDPRGPVVAGGYYRGVARASGGLPRGASRSAAVRVHVTCLCPFVWRHGAHGRQKVFPVRVGGRAACAR